MRDLARATIDFLYFGRSRSIRVDIRAGPSASRMVSSSLGMRRAVGQGFQQRQAAAQMIDRLDIGRALRRPLAGLSPVGDGRLSEAGLRVVVGEQFGLFLDRLRKLLLQRFGDPAVLDAPIRSEQRVVGGVLDQRVLERVTRLRRVAALEDQLGFGKPPQRADAARPRKSRSRPAEARMKILGR